MNDALALETLLETALSSSHFMGAEERAEVAKGMAASVSDYVLAELFEEDATRSVGEQLQRAMLSGEDLLVVALREGLTKNDAFVEAFGNSIARVINEIIEVAESDDSADLRKRLHESVIAKMSANSEE